MIKCDWENVVEIKGTMADCLAEYGVLSEQLIKSVPKIARGHVAKALAHQLRIAVENALEVNDQATKGGEENEESE